VAAPAPAPRKQIILQVDITHPGLYLALAGLILLIGVVAPWYPELSGWEAGMGKITLFLALIMFGTAAISLDIVRSRALEKVFPTFGASWICGFIAIVTSLIRTQNSSWGLYLTIVGGVIAIIAAICAYIRRI
jgi:hypothetical protein